MSELKFSCTICLATPFSGYPSSLLDQSRAVGASSPGHSRGRLTHAKAMQTSPGIFFFFFKLELRVPFRGRKVRGRKLEQDRIKRC